MRMRVTLVSMIALAVLISAVPLCAENNQAVENSLKTKNKPAGRPGRTRTLKHLTT